MTLSQHMKGDSLIAGIRRARVIPFTYLGISVRSLPIEVKIVA